MISDVLTLFKTFFEIILLRKGPGDIPHSSTLFIVVTAIWFLVGIVAVMIVDTYKSSGLFVDLILAIVGLGIYAIVVNAFGKSERLLRCLTAILGCGIVFSVVLFSVPLVLPFLLTADEIEWAVQVIWFWSIPVEGHILAGTVGRPWLIGFLIALTVLFAQLQLFTVLKPMLGPAG